jgi:hypothetical protein
MTRRRPPAPPLPPTEVQPVSAGRAPATALRYTDRHGGAWYLHEGRTKTGKPRYFVAREVGEGACAALPAGMELRESINGVDSVAKIDRNAAVIPAGDVELVRAELARHKHLWKCTAAAERGVLVVYQAEGISGAELFGIARLFGLGTDGLDVGSPRRRYSAVMKFTPEAKPGVYSLSRYVYRGDGSWHWLDHGPLAGLAKKYLRHIGTDAFYELI